MSSADHQYRFPHPAAWLVVSRAELYEDAPNIDSTRLIRPGNPHMERICASDAAGIVIFVTSPNPDNVPNQSPTTDEIGFIELPLRKAGEIIVKKLQKTVPLRTTEHAGTLKENLGRLLPLTTVAAPRRMFLQTNSRWTAYFDNGWRGTDGLGD